MHAMSKWTLDTPAPPVLHSSKERSKTASLVLSSPLSAFRNCPLIIFTRTYGHPWLQICIYLSSNSYEDIFPNKDSFFLRGIHLSAFIIQLLTLASCLWLITLMKVKAPWNKYHVLHCHVFPTRPRRVLIHTWCLKLFDDWQETRELYIHAWTHRKFGY